MKPKEYLAKIHCNITKELEQDLKQLADMTGKSVSCIIREQLVLIPQILNEIKNKQGDFVNVAIKTTLNFQINHKNA